MDDRRSIHTQTSLLLEDYLDSSPTQGDARPNGRHVSSEHHHSRSRWLSDAEAELASQLSEERVKKRRPFPFALVAFGLLLLVIGTLAPGRLDQAVSDAVWESIRLDTDKANGFQSFANGEDVDVASDDTIYLRFRVYDIQNAHRLIKGEDEKFQLVEKGPYVYRLRLRHLNITYFGEDLGDYDRSHLKEMYFKTWQSVQIAIGEPDGGMDDSEIITQLSMTYQIVEAIAKSLLPNQFLHDLILKYFLGDTLKERQQKMFTTRSVREHLFGYRETFRGNSNEDISSLYQQVFDTIESQVRLFPHTKLGRFHLQKPSGIGLDYPGFVQNFSSAEEVDAKMAFDAHRVDRQMMHTYFWYQGSSQLRRCNQDTCPPLWNSRQANRVLGSDGKFWGGKSHSENLIFLSALERTALTIKDNTTSKISVDGIECNRYRLHPNVFSNVTYFPENADYYGTDQPVGLLNLSPVLFDIPIYASKPRYLHGDLAELLQCCEGIAEGNEDEHDTTFDVHEETGISVLVSERFQYSLRIPSSRPGKQNWFVPIFWFETIEKMSNKHEKLFRKCDTYVLAARWFKYFGYALGISCLVLGVGIGTDRAERDAKLLQVKAVYEHAFTNANVEEVVESGHEDNTDVPTKHGFKLLLTTKSIRDGWFTTIPFVFFVNIIIATITLKAKRIGVWSPYHAGDTSAALQMVLTSLFVGIFISMSGVAIARAAFIRGEVPRHKIIYRPIHRRNCYVFPWLFTDHACYMGVIVGFSFVILWAGFVLLMLYIFVCGSPISQGICDFNWVIFILFKSAFAALEASIVFPLACLKTLNDASYMEGFSQFHPNWNGQRSEIE
jgi:hypothetical protein